MGLRVVPITIKAARRFNYAHHRHNKLATGGLFAVGVADDDGNLVGIGIAGIPKAINAMDGTTIEVSRCCTTGQRNAASMVYGALVRAARALGYKRVITYTRAAEDGASLKASNWVPDVASEGGSWLRSGRPGRSQPNLFGEMPDDLGPKQRWRIDL